MTRKKLPARKKATKKRPEQPDEAYALYAAVQKYVESRGGNIAVIGGIQIQSQWPGESEFHFRVAVKCLGRKPELHEKASR